MNGEQSYLSILRNIYENGIEKTPTRGSESVNPTIMLPFQVFEHDMDEGFPALTTRRVPFISSMVELEGFIGGITDKRWYQERKSAFWNEWCAPDKIARRMLAEGLSNIDKETKLRWQKEEVDLGPFYAHQIRNFNKTYQPIPHAKLKDSHQPISVLGIGSLGDKSYNKTVPHWQKLRKSWQQMLRRCYADSDKDYKNYGGRGVFVDDDWLIFSNYLRDIQTLPNWDKKLQDWSGYSLDKDIAGGKCYSKQTCVWASAKEQVRNTIQIDKYRAFNDKEERIFDSIEELEASGFTRTCVIRCCSGKRKRHGGFYWERLRNRKNDHEQGIDQLANMVDKLKNNPYDRRLLVSYWNPLQLEDAALPCCHYAFQVVCYDDRISLVWMQRSADVPIGIPSNITYYAMLLVLLGKASGLRPHKLSGILSDAHIYKNQLPGVIEQLKRTPGKLPTVQFLNTDNGDFDILSWTHKDVKLIDYNPQPKIGFELTV